MIPAGETSQSRGGCPEDRALPARRLATTLAPIECGGVWPLCTPHNPGWPAIGMCQKLDTWRMKEGIRLNRSSNCQGHVREHSRSVLDGRSGCIRGKREPFQSCGGDEIGGTFKIQESRRHSQHLKNDAETEKQNQERTVHATRRTAATAGKHNCSIPIVTRQQEFWVLVRHPNTPQ